MSEQFAAALLGRLVDGEAASIEPDNIPSLRAILEAHIRRAELARTHGRRGGRPRAKAPAPGTMRSRKSRERKADKKGEL
jgi:hypothetical protein